MNTPRPKPDATEYTGVRFTRDGRVFGVSVRVDAAPLDPRPSFDLRNHSPTGFEWGYCGSGPHQLALALLYDATGDSELSLAAYDWFTRAVVSSWSSAWTITAGEVRRLLAQYAREKRFSLDRSEVEPFVAEGGGI